MAHAARVTGHWFYNQDLQYTLVHLVTMPVVTLLQATAVYSSVFRRHAGLLYL
jgi:hypothetical protein